jgi:Protein of unknown function (DUF3383)
MADPIQDIVQVNITANTVSPTRLGFGTPLVLTHHTRFPEAYRAYSSSNDMIVDGFTSYDDAYRMVSKILSQNPSVPQVIVGRKSTAPAFSTELTITSAVEGQRVQLKVVQPATGVVSQIDYLIPAAATTTTVATAVELLIEAVTGVASASSAAVITVTPEVAGRKVHMYDLVNCTQEEVTADANFSTDLDALALENDDWYFVLINSSSEANILDVAAWAEANESPKIFLADLSNTTGTALASSTDIAAALKLDSLKRTASLFTFDSDDFGASAWTGRGATSTPGFATWANKPLVGVTPKALTTTQKNALLAENVNYFITIRGRNMTQSGKVANGEFIDIVHGIDALTADIQESVLAVIAGSDKVPFNKAGFTVIEGTILGALKRFEAPDDSGVGLLNAGSSVVIMPALESISLSDRQNRRLTGVKFTATLAGAVHFVSVVGTLSL